MNLQQQIFQERREEVFPRYFYSREHASSFSEWVERYEPGSIRLLKVEQEVRELAMNTQADFYRWASINYVWLPNLKHWEHVDCKEKLTELELYNIFRKRK